MDNEKKSSRLGVGLIIGSIMGIATGFFLQSRKGKQLSKDAQKTALQLQKQVLKKLENIDELTKEKYSELIDQAMDFYEKSKAVAKTEAPKVRAYLLSRWKAIEAHLKKDE